MKSLSRLTGRNEYWRESNEKGYTHVLNGQVADPNRSNFPSVEELLHLGPGVVEVDFVSRFKRTVRVPGKDLYSCVG